MARTDNEITKSADYGLSPDSEEAQRIISGMINKCEATVFKNYLPYISESYGVAPLDCIASPEETVAFFDITRLVIEEKERMHEKLKNIYHLLAYSDKSIALIVHRKHDSCQIGLAVGKGQDSEATAKLAECIQDAMLGNFPGTTCGEINAYTDTEDCVFQALNKDLFFNETNVLNHNSVAVVSNIASEFSEDYINQGIEKIIDGIVPSENKEYTMVILGESLNNEMMERKKSELYAIYTGLSPFSKRTENWSVTEGKNWGKNFNGNLILIGGGKNSGESKSSSSGSSVEINQYAVTHTLEIIEKQMERLEKCEALGIWNIAAYVFSPDCQLAGEVAHMYMSLTQGNESYYEKPAINIWNAQKDQQSRVEIEHLSDYVRHLIHPCFIKRTGDDVKDEISYWPSQATATSVISGAELALAMNLPQKSVPGFSIIECAAFGREIISYDKEYAGDVHLGKIHHMLHEEKPVELNRDSFASHVFVTGSTGAGKSNTVFTLLDSLKTTFMVIEPAKGEYKYEFTSDVEVYGSNPHISKLLKINPFAFNKDIHVYEHIDRLLDVFNVCWPMYAAMPAVLKDAIIKAYEDCGWNMITSENDKGDVFPTFRDVCDEIDIIINSSDYSDENKGNYRGSLKTRLNSLTNGLNQMIFCNGNLSDAELFEKNTIVDLSRIGSNENKSLIMGILVIRLQEYRMSERIMTKNLRHITVLEEAHNLLRKSAGVNSEGVSVSEKSVEMISNAIAEMRAFGEGFIIVDQAPALLDMAAIRNTNTKIIHRLPDKDDRELVGRAANLNDEQIKEIARLQCGVAAVYQNEWVEPILCKVDEHCSSKSAYDYQGNNELFAEDSDARRYINTCVYDPEFVIKKGELEFLDCVDKIQCDGVVKSLLIDYYRTPFSKAQRVWQKLAFRYFNMRDCVKCLDGKQSKEEWIEIVKKQLDKFDFEESVELSVESESFYRFTQLMTLETIVWLHDTQIDKPEKGLVLKNYMSDYRDTFVEKSL